MSDSTSLKLKGCTPEPLSAYLKAAGILRIVTEQLDRNASGYWRDDFFYLQTSINCNSSPEILHDCLTNFFLHEYQPTPLISPWNGSTGFYPKDKAQQKLFQQFYDPASEQPKRFEPYKAIAIAREQVGDLAKQPSGEEKRQLLERLRGTLPESVLSWLDASTLVTSDSASFPPLLGTGGNDGNVEFSRTFMQQLGVVFDLESGKPTTEAKPLLDAALFDKVLPDLNYSGRIGQFNPIAAGGTNAAPGFDGDSRVNPWDFIFMLEGSMLFSAGATRRYEQDVGGLLSYPFTVRPSSSGYASAGEDKSRAEIWLPLWSKPVRWNELQFLFREGRATLNNRTAIDGTDFAQAIAQLGVTRGIEEFVRYSFQERNGLSYFAVPLGRFRVKNNPDIDLLAPLDPWLQNLRYAVSPKEAPASLKSAHRHLETTIINLSQSQESDTPFGNASERSSKLIEVAIALGKVEETLDRSFRTKKTEDKYPAPIFIKKGFSWASRCQENTPEFRLALALAGQNLRERLVWVRRGEKGRLRWLDNDDYRTTWRQGWTLEKNLTAWLQRVEIEERQKERSPLTPLNKGGIESSSFNKGGIESSSLNKGGIESSSLNKRRTEQMPPMAQLNDVLRWLMGEVDQQRIEAIARGLSLLDLQGYQPNRQGSLYDPDYPIPANYALLKLAHYRDLTLDGLEKALQKTFSQEAKRDEGERLLLEKKREILNKKRKILSFAVASLPLVPGLLARLAAGKEEDAIALAARRLHASGLRPFTRQGYKSNIPASRLAGALAFPLDPLDILRLLRSVQKLDPNKKDNNSEDKNHDEN